MPAQRQRPRRCPDRADQAVARHRLEQEAGCTRLDGRQQSVVGVEGRQHDHRRVQPWLGQDPAGRLQTVDAGLDPLLLLAKAEQGDFVRREPVELADLTTELLVTTKEHAQSVKGTVEKLKAEGAVDVL